MSPYGEDHTPGWSGYADGTSGHSGTDTSRERAEHERDSGLRSKRQRETLIRLQVAGDHGLTWRDLADLGKMHHGSASSVLTNLHKAGLIVRTQRTRGRSKIYVLPDSVRPSDVTEPYVARKDKPNSPEQRVAILEDRIERAFMALMTGDSGTAMTTLSEE